MSFHGLGAHFFLALNNTSLTGCAIVYLSVAPAEGHLGGFHALASVDKLLQTSVCRILCGHKFSVP